MNHNLLVIPATNQEILSSSKENGRKSGIVTDKIADLIIVGGGGVKLIPVPPENQITSYYEQEGLIIQTAQ